MYNKFPFAFCPPNAQRPHAPSRLAQIREHRFKLVRAALNMCLCRFLVVCVCLCVCASVCVCPFVYILCTYFFGLLFCTPLISAASLLLLLLPYQKLPKLWLASCLLEQQSAAQFELQFSSVQLSSPPPSVLCLGSASRL